MVLVIKATFWRPYWEILTSRYFEAKDGQYSNNCQTPLNNRFQVVLCACHQEDILGLVRGISFLNPLRTKIWPNCTNCDTPLSHRFIRFYGPYRQSDTLELLQCYFYLQN